VRLVKYFIFCLDTSRGICYFRHKVETFREKGMLLVSLELPLRRRPASIGGLCLTSQIHPPSGNGALVPGSTDGRVMPEFRSLVWPADFNSCFRSPPVNDRLTPALTGRCREGKPVVSEDGVDANAPGNKPVKRDFPKSGRDVLGRRAAIVGMQRASN
jgi:hypothetical protein